MTSAEIAGAAFSLAREHIGPCTFVGMIPAEEDWKTKDAPSMFKVTCGGGRAAVFLKVAAPEGAK